MDVRRIAELEREKSYKTELRNKDVSNDLTIDLRNKSDHTIKYRKQQILNNLLRKEEIFETEVLKSNVVKEPSKFTPEWEEKIIDNLRNADQHHLCEEKRRLQLRLNSTELRDLEQNLKKAYYKKEIDDILSKREESKQIEKVKKLEEIKQTKQECANTKLEEQKFEQERSVEREKYRICLINQQKDAIKRKQEELQECLRDKFLVDEALRKIQEEDIERSVEAAEKVRRNLKNMVDAQRIRENLKKRDTEKIQEENEKIEMFQLLKQQQQELQQKNLEEKNFQMEMMKDKLAKKLLQEHTASYELNEMQLQRSILEHEMIQQAKEQRELQRNAQQKYNLKKMFADQLDLKADITQRQKEEEKEFHRQILEKLAEEERIEKINSIRRRNKQIEYKEEIDKFLKDKETQLAMRKEQEMLELKKIEDFEKMQEEMIAMEKIRLLEEHGSNLLNYLPKDSFGILEQIQNEGPKSERLYKCPQVDEKK